MSISINALQANALRSAELNPSTIIGVIQRPSVQRTAPVASSPSAVVSVSAGWTSQSGTSLAGLIYPTGGASSQISLLQTANNAVNSVKTDLLRMQDFAVAASRAKITQRERESLQQYATQLAADIDRISNQAQFNGVRLFEQNRANVTGDPSMAKILEGLKGGWLENAEKMIQEFYGLKADGAPLSVDLSSFSDGPYGVAARVSATVSNLVSSKGTNLKLQLDRADFLPATLPNGGVAPLFSDRVIAHELTHAVLARTTNYADLTRNSTWFVEGIAEFIHGGDERMAWDLSQVNGNPQRVVDALRDGTLLSSIDYSASYAAVRYLHDQIKSAGGEGVKDVLGYLNAHQSASLNDAFRHAIAPMGAAVSRYTSTAAFLNDFYQSGAAYISASLELDNADTGAIGGADADGGSVKTAASVIPDGGTRTGNNVLYGFNERFDPAAISRTGMMVAGQFDAYASPIRKSIVGAMNASALGVSALNLIDDPDDAVGQISRALRYVGSEQSRISAQLGGFDSMFTRLQSLFAYLGTQSWWSYGTGYSGSLIAGDIRSHAETAILAQDHISQQLALQLLRVA